MAAIVVKALVLREAHRLASMPAAPEGAGEFGRRAPGLIAPGFNGPARSALSLFSR